MKIIMASLFEYEKEAIRIKVYCFVLLLNQQMCELNNTVNYVQARRVDSGKDEYRKFSVDPNIFLRQF